MKTKDILKVIARKTANVQRELHRHTIIKHGAGKHDRILNYSTTCGFRPPDDIEKYEKLIKYILKNLEPIPKGQNADNTVTSKKNDKEHIHFASTAKVVDNSIASKTEAKVRTPANLAANEKTILNLEKVGYKDRMAFDEEDMRNVKKELGFERFDLNLNKDCGCSLERGYKTAQNIVKINKPLVEPEKAAKLHIDAAKSVSKNRIRTYSKKTNIEMNLNTALKLITDSELTSTRSPLSRYSDIIRKVKNRHSKMYQDNRNYYSLASKDKSENKKSLIIDRKVYPAILSMKVRSKSSDDNKGNKKDMFQNTEKTDIESLKASVSSTLNQISPTTPSYDDIENDSKVPRQVKKTDEPKPLTVLGKLVDGTSNKLLATEEAMNYNVDTADKNLIGDSACREEISRSPINKSTYKLATDGKPIIDSVTKVKSDKISTTEPNLADDIQRITKSIPESATHVNATTGSPNKLSSDRKPKTETDSKLAQNVSSHYTEYSDKENHILEEIQKIEAGTAMNSVSTSEAVDFESSLPSARKTEVYEDRMSKAEIEKNRTLKSPKVKSTYQTEIDMITCSKLTDGDQVYKQTSSADTEIESYKATLPPLNQISPTLPTYDDSEVPIIVRKADELKQLTADVKSVDGTSNKPLTREPKLNMNVVAADQNENANSATGRQVETIKSQLNDTTNALASDSNVSLVTKLARGEKPITESHPKLESNRETTTGSVNKSSSERNTITESVTKFARSILSKYTDCSATDKHRLERIQKVETDKAKSRDFMSQSVVENEPVKIQQSVSPARINEEHIYAARMCKAELEKKRSLKPYPRNVKSINKAAVAMTTSSNSKDEKKSHDAHKVAHSAAKSVDKIDILPTPESLRSHMRNRLNQIGPMLPSYRVNCQEEENDDPYTVYSSRMPSIRIHECDSNAALPIPKHKNQYEQSNNHYSEAELEKNRALTRKAQASMMASSKSKDKTKTYDQYDEVNSMDDNDTLSTPKSLRSHMRNRLNQIGTMLPSYSVNSHEEAKDDPCSDYESTRPKIRIHEFDSNTVLPLPKHTNQWPQSIDQNYAQGYTNWPGYGNTSVNSAISSLYSNSQSLPKYSGFGNSQSLGSPPNMENLFPLESYEQQGFGVSQGFSTPSDWWYPESYQQEGFGRFSQGSYQLQGSNPPPGFGVNQVFNTPEGFVVCQGSYTPQASYASQASYAPQATYASQPSYAPQASYASQASNTFVIPPGTNILPGLGVYQGSSPPPRFGVSQVSSPPPGFNTPPGFGVSLGSDLSPGYGTSPSCSVSSGIQGASRYTPSACALPQGVCMCRDCGQVRFNYNPRSVFNVSWEKPSQPQTCNENYPVFKVGWEKLSQPQICNPHMNPLQNKHPNMIQSQVVNTNLLSSNPYNVQVTSSPKPFISPSPLPHLGNFHVRWAEPKEISGEPQLNTGAQLQITPTETERTAPSYQQPAPREPLSDYDRICVVPSADSEDSPNKEVNPKYLTAENIQLDKSQWTTPITIDPMSVHGKEKWENRETPVLANKKTIKQADLIKPIHTMSLEVEVRPSVTDKKPKLK